VSIVLTDRDRLRYERQKKGAEKANELRRRFIWENGTWYENIEKITVTTTKHRTQTHPHEDTLPMTCKDMVVIMDHGIVGVAVGLAS